MENNSVINLNTYLEYFKWEKRTITLLDSIGNKLQKKMQECKESHISVLCPNCDNHEKIKKTCQIRICERCETTRTYKIKKRLKPFIKLYMFPKLMTLTFSEHKLLTPNIKQKCELNCREFRRRMLEKGYPIDGVRFLEAKPKHDGFHIHFHYVIDSRRYIPQKLISNIWLEVTGNSYIVDIRKINQELGLMYALKYTSKPLDVRIFKSLGFSDWNIIKSYVSFFYKKRMFTKVGKFYNVVINIIKMPYLCQKCGSSDWIIDFNFEEPFEFQKEEIEECKDYGGENLWNY